MDLFSPVQSSQKAIGIGTGIIASAALVALLYYGRDFFITLIVSILLAFILDPAVVLVSKLRIPRAAASAIVIGIAFVALYFLSLLLVSQASIFAEDLPGYASRMSQVVDALNQKLDDVEKKTIEIVVPKPLREQQAQIQQKPQEAMRARRRHAGLTPQPDAAAPPPIQEVRLHADPPPLIATIYGYVSGYFHVLLMASFSPFLIYFMLSWRDHVGKSLLRLVPADQQFAVERTWLGIGESTRAYVLGNFILWVFLSSVSAIVFFLLGVPYWPIIGPLSGFLSLMPYIGLPLSIVPPLLAAMAVPNKFKVVLTLLAVTAALHIVAMNFLYAKIIGRRVRLNPLVITIALMFWGGVWGAIGLLLAVPLTAGIKTVCDNVESLGPYGKLLGD